MSGGAGSERLQALRAEAAVLLAQRLQAGDAPLSELRELQERVRLLDAALADPALQRRARRRALAGSLFAVALLTSLAALIEMPRVAFSLEVSASSAALQMDAASELGAQALDGELQIEGYTALESADAALVKRAQQARAQGSDQLAVRAASLRLRRLAYPAASLLRFEAGPETARITVEAVRPPVLAELEVAGATRIGLAGPTDGDGSDYGPGEWLRLTAGDATRPERRPPPLTLALPLARDRSYAWDALRPVALRFVERQSRDAAAPRFVSSLQQARITLPATGRELSLRAGDTLQLDDLRLERCELVLGRELQLRLSGSAGGLLSRTGGFERSYKPSVLEFLARHHTVELVWGAAVMLWGAGTWLRRQFDAA